MMQFPLTQKKVVPLMVAGLLATAPAVGQDAQTLTENDVIAGTMNIQFRSRVDLDTSGKFAPGSPRLGVKDEYKVNMRVAKTTEFSGAITRLPKVKVKVVGMEAQPAAYMYDLDLAVLNPKDLTQKKNVGKWVGTVPLDTKTNILNLGGGKAGNSELRIAVEQVGSAHAFTDSFNGTVGGKQDKEQGWEDKLVSYSFERVIGKKKVKIEAKQVEPVKFQNVELAKGPSAIYPHAFVSGSMDFDYETGNWYINNVRFRYNLDGKDLEDRLSGSIKWVEDPNRAQNGIGYYDFNVRFNEEKFASAANEADAFGSMNDEEAFFAVDNSIPAMTGRVGYVDTFIPGSEMKPSASRITYNLNANKLTKQQIMNFYKLWMLAMGPVNDE